MNNRESFLGMNDDGFDGWSLGVESGFDGSKSISSHRNNDIVTWW